uniref:Mitochondrial ATP synthase subunit ASA6 n=2 Tax=Polytomella TaxID=3049 RepID=E6PBK8_9CHLO|nr:Chain N, Mitochondrial ATP synthase subunit ASA6 [Polytomella sp. Pringsheim 198.80]6RD4_6 Chain 6, Mitochondrial ATP synthase subunit ASA6 [Polytomella sp. Pringsheim 198.80]6RD5_6 Chain 6, Mitochondrial ATP synthase subunit ASA6 [Polytomella sp. Pringsheim 198.80]6RD7_6 Chain 6, Mitochondrial ATP synthase subunit ASA6 [Polytomella sp. Pringsheim 198.80]6RD8_6 Chain 6, Mitochondrial ATP synthase subunit ASA6 [Polytomella sp. Pringsheim 198.80]6RD9_6 Chain 6, Mitochondrial ATP synthase subu
MMLRTLTRSSAVAGQAVRLFKTSAAAAEGNSVAGIIKSVNETSGANLLSSLKTIKAQAAPIYPAAASSTGYSTQAKIALFGALSWILYRADGQSKAHEWIVDLNLNVLQAAWLISFSSLIPFRAVYFAFRGMAPATASTLNGLKTFSSISL